MESADKQVPPVGRVMQHTLPEKGRGGKGSALNEPHRVGGQGGIPMCIEAARLLWLPAEKGRDPTLEGQTGILVGNPELQHPTVLWRNNLWMNRLHQYSKQELKVGKAVL